MKKSIEWFLERIGKVVLWRKEVGNTERKGFAVAVKNHPWQEMLIDDKAHAEYLCNVAQEYTGYAFSDVVEPLKESVVQ